MKITDTESGGTLIEISGAEGAVVVSETESNVIIPKVENIPNSIALLAALHVRLENDEDFRAEMEKWFNNEIGEEDGT